MSENKTVPMPPSVSEDSAPVVVSKKAKPIEVVADQEGFYDNVRLRQGDKFTISGDEAFGKWFHCVEAADEKRRVAFLEKKAARNKAKARGEAEE